MKCFVFLVMLCVCGVANAATMCVPDLSTCESCTDGTYDGYSWSANCCGVNVSGIGFWVGNWVASYTQSVPQNISIEQRDEGGSGYVACLMTSPFVSDYFHVPILSYTMSSIVGGWCSRLFNPKCAIVGCDLEIEIDGNWSDPA